MKLDPLPPDVARLLDESREIPAAPAAARARVLARLEGIPQPQPGAPAAGSGPVASTAATSTATKLAAAKLPLALGTFLLGIGVGVVAQRAVAPPAPQLITVIEAAPADAPAPPPVRVVPVEEAREATVTPAAPPAPSPAPPRAASTLARERALLELARMAAPAQALVHLERHRREFPEGALAEERDALTVRALAGAGRAADARAAAASFLARYPRSLFRGVVEAHR